MRGLPKHVTKPVLNGMKTVYTKKETAHHRRVINELLSRLFNPDRIVVMMYENFGISSKRTNRLIQEELSKWDNQSSNTNISRKRIAAENRLTNYLEECRKRFFSTDKKTPKGSMKDIMMIEEHLAKIQGTLSPIRVDVSVSISANMAAVLANLSSDQINAALSRQKALRQAANVAYASNLLMPDVEAAVRPIIETEGVAFE